MEGLLSNVCGHKFKVWLYAFLHWCSAGRKKVCKLLDKKDDKRRKGKILFWTMDSRLSKEERPYKETKKG
jgi:hypothetical protein